jgi:anti-anti-sigma factor
MEIVPDRLTADELIHQLPDRIQYLLALRFHGNLNQTQIAGELGISQMHVSRLLTRALTWLRAAMLSDVPPAWTDSEGHRMDGLQVRTSQAGETVTVAVYGEVDRDTADRLRFSLHSAVATASAGRVVIDVSGMPLMDAAGAAVLRDAYVTAKLARVTLAFTGAQPQVAVVLAAVGLPPWSDVPEVRRRPPKDRAPSGGLLRRRRSARHNMWGWHCCSFPPVVSHSGIERVYIRVFDHGLCRAAPRDRRTAAAAARRAGHFVSAGKRLRGW